MLLIHPVYYMPVYINETRLGLQIPFPLRRASIIVGRESTPYPASTAAKNSYCVAIPLA
jgi:hypothetical protein